MPETSEIAFSGLEVSDLRDGHSEADDAAWGRMIRQVVTRWHTTEESAAMHLFAARVLIALTTDLKSDTATATFREMTKAGEPIGDWEVVVRRMDGERTVEDV